jgi:uncharacterized membrane protein YedE/YeeE
VSFIIFGAFGGEKSRSTTKESSGSVWISAAGAAPVLLIPAGALAASDTAAVADTTPVLAAFGGVLIGLAAALLLLLNGRIAGISGILGGALGLPRDDLAWRLAFLVGLPTGSYLYSVIAQGGIPIRIDASLGTLVVAGMLVGLGTRLGNGCTSGHGVCGVARGSRRSIAATATFMGVAALTVFIVRHAMGG